MLSVDEIVEEYRQNLVDADATDEDLLYLRGYLARALQERPSEEEVALALEKFLRDTQALQAGLNSIKPVTQEALLRALAEIRLYRRALKRISNFYQRFMRATAQIEERYARFIKLARLRSTINYKNAPAEQLAFFNVTVQHYLQLLSNRISQEKLDLLQARLKKDFEELPERALTLTALKPITLSTGHETSYYRSHQLNDRLDEIVSSLRSQSLDLDNTDEDMLRLRAHLRSLRQLVELIATTATTAASALEELDAFLDTEGVEVEVRKRGEWEKVERLHAELTKFHLKLEGFDRTLEVRHERIIFLAQARQQQRLQETATDRISLYQLRLERLRHLLLDVLTVEDYQAMETGMLEALNN